LLKYIQSIFLLFIEMSIFANCNLYQLGSVFLPIVKSYVENVNIVD